MSHSLGGNFVLYFLSSVSASWKRRFVHAFVPLGAPWAGSAVAFNLYAAGDNREVDEIDHKIIREEQRSYETGEDGIHTELPLHWPREGLREGKMRREASVRGRRVASTFD